MRSLTKQEEQLMKEVQQYTPKYWVVHRESTDDVYILSASKNLTSAKGNYVYMYVDTSEITCAYADHFDAEYAEELKVVLIEIKLVDTTK